MDESKALQIISTLADGIDPATGEVFASSSPYQSADVVRALFVAVRALGGGNQLRTRNRTEPPTNAGKNWSAEEDRKLLSEFDQGMPLAELAKAHARTVAGIQARLEKHGKIQAEPQKSAIVGGRWRSTARTNGD